MTEKKNQEADFRCITFSVDDFLCNRLTILLVDSMTKIMSLVEKFTHRTVILSGNKRVKRRV